jgi:OPA family glycerol-3-phosphate transporter-like MFS transporter
MQQTEPTDGRKRLRAQQALVVLLLFAGYAAYYFCRANLSVATPLIADELQSQGIDREAALSRIGTISSLGIVAYALGKLFLTGFADLWGGRRAFNVGLGGALVCTLVFALGGGMPIFTLAWMGNRLTQSVGWAGLLKVCSRWFDFNTYGRVVGVLSLSYLVGDAVARESMGALIERGVGWRGVFYYAAAIAFVLLVLSVALLRESRTDAGHPPARANPLNLFAADSGPARSLPQVMRTLLTDRAFVLVCLLSFGCTVVRESFNNWTPTYLNASAGFSVAQAAKFSAVFPAVGAVSVLATGWISDRLGANGRAWLLAVGLTASAATLAVLAGAKAGAGGAAFAVLLIGLTAFCILGPYSLLGGAMALDFGGTRAGASASGLIDGIGYVGGIAAGTGIARIAAAFGWHGVFVALAGVCLLSAVAAFWLAAHQTRKLVANRA